jgi:hypothetical protein
MIHAYTAEDAAEYDYAVSDAKKAIVSQLSDRNFVMLLMDSKRGNGSHFKWQLECLIHNLEFLLDHAN